MKIVFLDAATMGDASFEPIARLGELVCYDKSDADEALERVGDCDVLIINKVKVTPQLIDAAKNLKLIVNEIENCLVEDRIGQCVL